MSLLLSDLRHAMRDLRHRPVFAGTVILTLAIGIGATTAAFALVDAVFFTRQPVRGQEALVEMRSTAPSRGAPRFPVPFDIPQILLAEPHAFVGVAAWRSNDPYPFAARAGTFTAHIMATGVDGNFFRVLGVRPVLGRLLQPEDDAPNGPDVVVLSDRVWHRDFGGDPGIIGRLLVFAGGAHRVIGVAPPEFSYPGSTSAWTPIVREIHRQNVGTMNDDLRKWGFFLVGRLRPGVTLQAARTDLDAALRTDSLSGRYTADWGALPTEGVTDRYTDVVLGQEVRPAVIILFGAVALVLIIACTNVAGLLLARGISRATELAVRSAVGASHGQLVRHLLGESLVLGTLGGALGLVTAAVFLRAAVAFAPPDLPMVATAHLDPAVLMFAVISTGVSVGAFGLAPALRGARSAPNTVLQSGTRSVTGSPLLTLARRGLVAGQVALALVVLSSAGILGRALLDLEEAPLGFAPAHLLFFRLDFMVPSSVSSAAAFDARWHTFLGAMTRRVPAVPGLGPMTTTLALPFSGNAQLTPYIRDGVAQTEGKRGRLAQYDHGLDDYFAVMGISLVRGRSITPQDDEHAPAAIVVNTAFARDAWPGRDPIGQRIRFPSDTVERWWTVIGEVGNTRYNDPAIPPAPTVYTSERQGPWLDPWFVVRVHGDPTRMAATLERAIEAIDPAFGISETTTGPTLVAARLARPRALSALFAALAMTALLLAAIGLFGILAAYVRERRREIAVRSALGATPARLQALILSQTITVAMAGLTFGLPLALAASHALRVTVRDVRPVDLLTIVGVVLVLLAVIAGATYLPIVRATQVDARTALAND